MPSESEFASTLTIDDLSTIDLDLHIIFHSRARPQTKFQKGDSTEHRRLSQARSTANVDDRQCRTENKMTMSAYPRLQYSSSSKASRA